MLIRGEIHTGSNGFLQGRTRGNAMKREFFNPEPCVLVVDDHDISRQHTVEALSAVICRVHQASDGHAAIECALRYLPDLVFMDIHLPDREGLSLMHDIRKAIPPDKPSPEFVILSGDGSDYMRQEAQESGASGILIKPVSAHEIRRTAITRLQIQHGVQETHADHPCQHSRRKLKQSFLKELDTRLPQLDQDVSSLDWSSAAELTHQLIASSALCEERNIEFHCRRLHEALIRQSPVSTIAQSYYSFRRAIEQLNPGIQAS
jgi:CheY-like chemotaxis protein